MGRILAVAAVILLSVNLFVGAAHAQSWEFCLTGKGPGTSFEALLNACNELLRGHLTRIEKAKAFLARAGWLHELKPDQALKDVTESLRLSPNKAEAYVLRAGILQSRNRKAEAIADLTRALALPIRNTLLARAHFQRGYLYHERGRRDLAIADYAKAIQFSDIQKDNVAETHHWRARAWEEQGELAKAEADFTAAISHNPSYIFYYGRRAELRAKLGNIDGAIADYNTVIRLDRDAKHYLARAALHEKKGNIEKALGDYRLASLSNSAAAAHVVRLRKILAAMPQPAVISDTIVSPQAGQLPQKDLALSTSERRIALVIGNSDYAHGPRLLNPRGDAKALATTLSRLGFTSVALRLDLSRERLIDELKSFARAAAEADWAVVYFAGHGLEIGGINYLIPVDAHLTSDRDVAYEAIALDHVLHAIDGAKKLRIAILDACRDNPFAKSMSRTMAATRSLGRGLAAVEPQRATLVAYAARHGQVALDGEGANSPYVSALIKNLEVPGLEISLLFRKVRDDVLTRTGNAQEPFTYGSLPSEAFYFRISR